MSAPAPLCERCKAVENIADYTDSVVDVDARGGNLNEPGYRIIYLCLAHALEARRYGSQHVKPLNADDEAQP